MPILDTSEQPDTAKGKNMAQVQTTKLIHSGNIIEVCVVAFVILIAAWTAFAAYLGFSGTFAHLSASAPLLAGLAGVQASLAIAWIVLRTKM